MTNIDERARHELYLAFEELIGAERADTLMAMLPPVGWADVATKHDVALLRVDLTALEERLDARFEALEYKLEARFERGLRELSHTFFLGMLTTNATLAALAFAAARLF
jgi:hypothetical protein